MKDADYQPMTKEEMQRYVDLQMRDGKSQSQALGDLAEALGLELPDAEPRHDAKSGVVDFVVRVAVSTLVFVACDLAKDAWLGRRNQDTSH